MKNMLLERIRLKKEERLMNTRKNNCQQCKKLAETEGVLKEHVSVHRNQSDNDCNKCEETIGTKNNFKTHDQMHTTENKFKCIKCSQTSKIQVEKRIHQIDEELGKNISEEYRKEILETLKLFGDDTYSINGSGRKQLWGLLKKKYPKTSPAIPVGKRNNKGKIITDHVELKHLYLQTYLRRLRNRPGNDDLEEIRKFKIALFEIRLKNSEFKKSDPWKMEQLENVLKNLKTEKARDPNGLINEIFKEGIAGNDLKISLLDFFNKMKANNFIPEFVRNTYIATIYKGKGEKCDLKNERGIFLVTVFRSILMKLIYSDSYNEIDTSMSDSQVGGRRGKNVRNHIWVLNGVICDILSSKKKKAIDIQIFDFKQCFDSLWLEECMNDIHTGGLNDDKFALLYNMNTSAKVVVKTPVGKTAQGSIQRAIIQGDVISPLMCSKQVDTFGKECLEERKYLYKYKGKVEIPPLGMVDDLICISECGHKTAMMNSYMNFKTRSKKLQFGTEKCKKLHIGKVKNENICQDLFVDKWIELEVEQENGETKYEDIEIEEAKMEEKNSEKYLGDIISDDGRNINNIKARVSKGKGIISRIMTYLDGIPFGKFYFEIAIILRNSLMLSSILFNSEAWYNLSKAELDLIESVDLMFLRSILKTPKSTPKEMLYLELGCLPCRDIIRQKRLVYLYYILKQNPESMIYRLFEAQRNNRTSKDWVTTIFKDMEEIKMNIRLDDIKSMKKGAYINLVKRNIENHVFENLSAKQEKHSKVNNWSHTFFMMQKYLKPNSESIKVEDSQNIFKLRCNMMQVKMNYKNLYETHECRACGENDETQEHILKCKILMESNNKVNKIPEYKKLFNGTVKDQLEISKVFSQNMEILETFR